MVGRDFLMACYWIIMISGLFGIFGAPVNFFIWWLMNTYMWFVSLIGFFTVILAAGGGITDENG